MELVERLDADGLEAPEDGPCLLTTRTGADF
jgi:hypothetical protein